MTKAHNSLHFWFMFSWIVPKKLLSIRPVHKLTAIGKIV